MKGLNPYVIGMCIITVGLAYLLVFLLGTIWDALWRFEGEDEIKKRINN